ncbi:MFS transporter [Roseiterribacter gracilis]|uniref:MFS transporter n=1 Tax=Roseiterribacter gracilis TaxID=2812848 RepID=A0A8S8XAV3_9PROT|nr:MFS transporter [Rhodospirillales bacterium TMPK1]
MTKENFRTAYAWYVVGLLTAGYAVAVLDRIVIGLLLEPIKAQFQLSDFQLALVSGGAFGVCYSVMAVPFGWLVDRYDRRLIAVIGIAGWSLATAANGLAQSFLGLFGARTAVGIGEASLSPAAASLIGDLFPGPQRAKAYGVFVSGASVGTGVAFFAGGLAVAMAEPVRNQFASLLGGFQSWQIAFMLTSIPGLVLALLFALTVREPPRRARAVDAAPVPPLWPYMRRNWKAAATIIFGVACNLMTIYTLIFFYSSMMVRVHHWAPQDVGFWVGIVGAPIGGVGAIFTGWFITYVAKRGRPDAPLITAVIGTVYYGTWCVLAALAPTGTWSIVCFIASAIMANTCVASAFAGLAQIAPNELRGRLIAFYTLVGGLVGLFIGPTVLGLISDLVFGAARLDLSLATAFGLNTLIGVTILLVGRKRYIAAVIEARANGV